MDLSEQQEPLNYLDRLVVKVGHTISFLFLVSALVIFYEVIQRYVFDSPTFWVHETTVMIGALLFVYGGSHCVAKDKHIRVVIIYDAVSPKVRRWLDVIIYAMCCVSTGMLAWAAWQVLLRAVFAPNGDIRFETTGSAWDPAFPAFIKITLFLILCLMFIQFVFRLINKLTRGSHV
ncbi:putative TRAP-type C4-dicarboxylate transport system, small permease component [Vibrio nigripulchritudo MADA3029]|uniref:TRAP transporter small permease protein n=1 Tax=Vibrio nigripulchritudo TaxID=28173 RepID=U4KBX1_9VIBR|nr:MULTISPECIES: TRAP transporter small permease subunit [Vibrio]EGU61652.1 tripartite ATP-independent periplasmic transporter DctQ [Vibrio nigripulchritudo ATCC 27043]KJY76983.1 C4-dicarboxylate ABC transporter permease [Vibrio nigripulchritudo]UAB68845.1 TRAP transporter small permease subunit [Vibrio sp. SCSIO 43132]CCN46732.1 putative TRAP-type C4-dicarboxylate transport system, small permease component [Vibrio nigripulchritudo MADA3020]CCN51987.1 putative TRAP-type C4-dicarboxylate transp